MDDRSVHAPVPVAMRASQKLSQPLAQEFSLVGERMS